MSFLINIFGNRKSTSKKGRNPSHSENPKIMEILELKDFIDFLLSKDSYLAK